MPLSTPTHYTIHARKYFDLLIHYRSLHEIECADQVALGRRENTAMRTLAYWDRLYARYWYASVRNSARMKVTIATGAGIVSLPLSTEGTFLDFSHFFITRLFIFGFAIHLSVTSSRRSLPRIRTLVKMPMIFRYVRPLRESSISCSNTPYATPSPAGALSTRWKMISLWIRRKLLYYFSAATRQTHDFLFLLRARRDREFLAHSQTAFIEDSFRLILAHSFRAAPAPARIRINNIYARTGHLFRVDT